MGEKKNFFQLVEEICKEDKRYKMDAYEFVMQALHYTQNKLKRTGHISGGELAEGMREFAIELYGGLAKTVLEHWGIVKTEDFGSIVFNMVNKKILSKTETDSLDDFKDLYDFTAVFSNVLRDSIIKEIKD